ncbi:acyl-CoA thioesterase domain-containing protein [Streptodolium elevatio]
MVLRSLADGTLSSELSDLQCMDGRGFGGWTAALAALAAVRAAGDRVLHTFRAVFTRQARVGELRIEAEPLVEGRTAAAYQVTVRQEGAVVLAAQCWFVDASLLAESGPATDRLADVPPVSACPRVHWTEEFIPCLAGFAEWAVEFPLSNEEFQTTFVDGGDVLSLWTAPAKDVRDGVPGVLDGHVGGSPDGVAERLGDLMMLDTHLMDAAHRTTPDIAMMTLDLTATWYARPRHPALTFFEARGRVDGLLAATEGTLVTPDGTVRATGTSQCRVYPRT